MNQRTLKGSRFYWSSLTAICMMAGAWTYYNASLHYVRCVDGHCPDPGSPEYLAGVKSMNEAAPFLALEMMVIVAAIGVAVRIMIGAARRLSKL